MPRVLYIDASPFVGGAQASFRTLVDCAPAEAKAMAAGAGLWPWAQQTTFPAIQLSTSHWPATPTGLFQYVRECRLSHPRLQKLLLDFQPDLIHCNTVRSALLICALPKIRVPVIIHDRDIRMPWLARYYAARKLSPHVLAVSSRVSRLWQGLVPESRREVLFNAFDLEGIAQTAPIRPYDANTLILAADFVPWKRHTLFLEAFRLAQQNHPALRGILKGRLRPNQEKYLGRLQSAIKKGPIPNIELIVDDSPALPWIAASQLLIACSETEPFGRTAIEALALGKRVVATRSSLAPELLSLPGVTPCEPTPDALAQAILHSLDAPTPAPILQAFSKETLAANLARIYSNL